MEDLKVSPFSVKIKKNGSIKEVKIIPQDNTDGIRFYFCEIDGKRVSEIRKDNDWEQLTGSLTLKEVKKIGNLIDLYEKV